MAEEIKRVINIETSKATKSIKELKNQVSALTDEIEGLEIGSREYAKKVQDLVVVQDKLTNATESLQGKSVNIRKAFYGLYEASLGLGAGLAAVQGALTLFGVEGEATTQTMVKLQAVMTILQGTQGVKELIKGVGEGVRSFKAFATAMGGTTISIKGTTIALKGLKTALISTGVGALVVALGFLIEHLVSAARETNELNDALGRFEGLNKQFDKNNKQRTKNIEAELRDLEVSEEKGEKSRIQALEKERDIYKKAAEDAKLDLSFSETHFLNSIAELADNNKELRKLMDRRLGDLSGQTDASVYYKKLKDFYEFERTSIEQALEGDAKSTYDNLVSEYESRVGVVEGYTNKVIELEHQITLETIKEENERTTKAKQAAQESSDKEEAKKEEILDQLAAFREENRKAQLSDTGKELYAIYSNYNEQYYLLKAALGRKLITQEQYDKDLIELNKATNVEIAAISKEYNDKQLEEDKEFYEKRLSALQNRQDRLSQWFANKQAALSAGFSGTYTSKAFDLTTFGSTTYQSKSDVNEQYAATLKYNEELFNLTEKRITQENDLLKQQELIFKEQLDNKLISQQEYNEQLEDLRLQSEANETELTQARNKREADDLKAFVDRQNKKTQAIQATFQVASSLTGALANVFKEEANNDKKSEAQREKSFKAYKALATTQAVIDTASSAQSAYKSMVGIPYVGPVLAPIAAAAAIIAGLANIKAIQNETLPSQGGASAGATVTAPDALSTAPIEYTRNILGNKEIDALNQPVKCYVLESDITNAQNKVSVTEDNASF